RTGVGLDSTVGVDVRLLDDVDARLAAGLRQSQATLDVLDLAIDSRQCATADLIDYIRTNPGALALILERRKLGLAADHRHHRNYPADLPHSRSAPTSAHCGLAITTLWCR